MSSTKNKIDKESEEIDFGRFIGELIDHKKIIIAITSLFAFFAIFYVIFSTPIYQADALIHVEQKQGNAILSNLSQILPDSQPQSAPEISLLQSRMVLGKTVDDLNLQIIAKEYHFPFLGAGWARLMGEDTKNISVSRFYIDSGLNDDVEATIKITGPKNYVLKYNDKEFKGTEGELLTDSGISVKIDRIDAPVGTEFEIAVLSRLKAITNLQKEFSVTEQGKDTGILNLTIRGSDADLIEKVLTSISNNYLSQNISRQAAQDQKSLEFLNSQLPKVREELNSAEDKLNNYRRQSDSVDLSLEAKSVLDQIVNVDNQLNELTFRESEISQLYTKEHPTYKALMEKRKTLQDEKDKLNKRVSGMPATQQEILRLSRDVESGQAVYMQLLNRQQELNIAKSSAIGNVRIIDSAVTQPKPVKPNKILVIFVSIVFGGMFSVGLVLLRVFLRRGIESPEQLEDLGINVYASVPVADLYSKKPLKWSGSNKKGEREKIQPFLAVENPTDIAIESIRGLRTSLHFAMMEAKNKVLMISGASPDVGKSFISTNLSAVVAQTDKKVLLIDADMRKGYTHQLFNVSNENGLSDILSGKINPDKAVKKIPGADIDFISRGAVPPNPAELLMHKRFESLISWADENYDLIIVDTPPILAVTDAAIIGKYVGATMLVARFELNTVKEMEVSHKRFEQSGVTIKGCILNGVVKKASSYYSYGYNNYNYTYESDK